MKKWLMLALFASACVSNGTTDSPETVAENMLKAMASGDIKTVRELSLETAKERDPEMVSRSHQLISQMGGVAHFSHDEPIFSNNKQAVHLEQTDNGWKVN